MDNHKTIRLNTFIAYTPPGLLALRTNQSESSNIPNYDWPYIVGAEIKNGPFTTQDGKSKKGYYVSYCWCNFPQLKYKGPMLNTTIKGM